MQGRVLSAFGEDHVVRLTGLSRAQLRYWRSTGFFRPQYEAGDRHSPYSRAYSFRDLVALRTIATLRKDHQVSLQHLREVATALAELGDNLWSEQKLYVLNREVYFTEPGTGLIRSAVSGQYSVIPIVDIVDDVADEVEQLRTRRREQIGQLTRNRSVAHNKWVVDGTRIPVEALLRLRADGYSREQILRKYPSLTAEDLTNVFAEAKEALALA